MCGIAGFVAADAPKLRIRATTLMVAALRRRGPDSEGIHSWPDATLGHRRLAILDLSDAGAQPMVSTDGQLGLVFNGCIYNFIPLREELEGQGCRFRSQSDTEVLLQGYRVWGIRELVRRINGMFAFAVWDQPLARLFLVRDRLGVKPLVYATSGKQIGFASTIDALRVAGLTGPVNPEAVLQFLEYGFVLDDSAIFEGVRKLPPATILEWQDGDVEEHRYWTLPAVGEARVSFEEAVDRTETLLLDAARMRLISDVPLGALLSGGIDSTLICWAMGKLHADITAYTVAVPGDADDETQAAEQTARSLGIEHRVVAMPDSSPALIDEMIDAFSEPFAVHSALGMLLVSEAVRPSAKVLLTGDGGDDVFLGYPFLRNAWTAERLARQLPESAPAIWKALRAGVPWQRVRSFLDYSTMGLGGHARAHDGLPWFEARGFLGEKLRHVQLEARGIPSSFQSARRLLSEVVDYHRKTHFTSEFLPKVDAGTMYFGIEARSPFLDQALWEFAASLPFPLRMRGGKLKPILREIVRRRVGRTSAVRRKQGFSIPVERRLGGRWSGAFTSLDKPTLLEEQGWISKGLLSSAILSARQGDAVPVQIWRLLVLERWLQRRASDSD